MKRVLSFLRRRAGFSLLEAVLALATVTIGLSALWTLVLGVQQTAQDKVMAQQILIVGRAAQAYINLNSTSLLTFLTTVGSVVEIRVRDSDSGEATLPSLVGAGFLPAGFSNSFALGQAYKVRVMREDSGTAGVSADDLLVGLVLTSGGQTLNDKQGARIAGLVGPSGGFVYSSATTQATGAFGGWALDLTTWGLAPGAGQLALLTKLADEGVGSRGTGANKFDDLSDSIVSSTYASFFLGQDAGLASTTCICSSATGVGYKALRDFYQSSSTTVAVGAFAGAGVSGFHFLSTEVGAYAAQNPASFYIYNSNLGYKAGQNYKGSYGVLVGANAGKSLSAAGLTWQSVAVGYNAVVGSAATTGTNNIFIGSGVQAASTTTSNSIAIGKGAANTAVDNNYQIAIGSQAAYSKRRTNSNWENRYIAIGSRAYYSTYGALASVANGIAIGESAAYKGGKAPSLAIGAQALGDNTGGGGTSTVYKNVGIGYGALYSDSSGFAYSNIAYGYKAAYATAASGQYSIYIGSLANSIYRSGGYETTIGYNANSNFASVSIGSGVRSQGDPSQDYYSVCIGYNAAKTANSASLANSTIVGSGALFSASATSAALNAAVVAGYQALYSFTNFSNGTYNAPMAIGWNALYAYQQDSSAAGEYTIAIGKNAGNKTSAAPVMVPMTSGSNNIIIGADVSTPTATTTNYMMLGTAIRTNLSTYQSVIGGTGNELPLAAGSADLYVAGKIQARNYFYTSDRRLKTDIQPLNGQLARLLKTRPVEFTWKANGEHSIGFIAQELYDIFPELVDTSSDDQWSVDYCSMTAPAMAAAQEQAARLDVLKKKKAELAARRDKLRQDVLERLAIRATEADLVLLRAEASRVAQGAAP